MTQSNLNQAGLEAAARAVETAIKFPPNMDRALQNDVFRTNPKALAKAAIAAYLECVDGIKPIINTMKEFEAESYNPASGFTRHGFDAAQQTTKHWREMCEGKIKPSPTTGDSR